MKPQNPYNVNKFLYFECFSGPFAGWRREGGKDPEPPFPEKAC